MIPAFTIKLRIVFDYARGLSCFLLLVFLLTGCQPSSSEKKKSQNGSTQNGNSQQKKSRQEDFRRPSFFADVTESSGLNFFHHIGDEKKYFIPDIIGAGCGVFDFNRDGLLDLVLIDSGDFYGRKTTDQSARSPVGCNRIFQQNRPGHFVDVTDSLGLMASGYGCGLAIADVNNDGFDDLYFTNYGDDTLFLNEGGTRFRNVTEESGIRNPSWGTSATFLDFDGDGLLDLFVTNYVSYLPETNCSEAGFSEDFCSPQVFEATVDRLFRNESQGMEIRFRDVTSELGIAKKKGPGLGVIARDFNLDGFPDIYVANDGKANFLWINKEGKYFEDQASLTGCAMSIKGEAQAGMGIAEGDIDLNGVADIVVTHIDGETNAAYLGDFVESGSGRQLFFNESGGAKGVQKISKPMTGFGVALPDLDNDGDQDMLTANGRVNRKSRDAGPEFLLDYAEKNQISLNEGKGQFVEYQSNDPFTEEISVSRGLVLLDWNDDGRLDCLVSNTGEQARLYQNHCNDVGDWIGFRVIDPEYGGRTALGARIQIKLGDGSIRTRTIQSDGSFLSACDPRAHFGLGKAETIQSVIVVWPNQKREQFMLDQINQYHEIQKGAGQPAE